LEESESDSEDNLFTVFTSPFPVPFVLDILSSDIKSQFKTVSVAEILKVFLTVFSALDLDVFVIMEVTSFDFSRSLAP
jgi:hypothetical protein